MVLGIIHFMFYNLKISKFKDYLGGIHDLTNFLTVPFNLLIVFVSFCIDAGRTKERLGRQLIFMMLSPPAALWLLPNLPIDFLHWRIALPWEVPIQLIHILW